MRGCAIHLGCPSSEGFLRAVLTYLPTPEGSLLLKPAHMTTDAEWASVIAANLTSSFVIVRLLSPPPRILLLSLAVDSSHK